MDMKKAYGRSCPGCGSEDSRPISAPKRWHGVDVQRRECTQCWVCWNARIDRKAAAEPGPTTSSAPDDLSTRPAVVGSTR